MVFFLHFPQFNHRNFFPKDNLLIAKGNVYKNDREDYILFDVTKGALMSSWSKWENLLFAACLLIPCEVLEKYL